MVAATRGLLLVLSGPSGAGKGTVRRRLAEITPVNYGVSATTRRPRPGEVDGKDYYFLSSEEFRNRIRRGEFLEWAEVYGSLYGTPREPLLSCLTEGQDVLVEKDIQGARTIRQRYPEAVLVFIMPPSVVDLEERVRGRGTEDTIQLERRLGRAREEMAAMTDYDYVLVNDDLDTCAHALSCIMVAERCRPLRFGVADRS